MNKPSLALAAGIVALALLGGCVAGGGHQNPIDPVSNVHELDYTDVQARRPDFDEPFLRDAEITQPGIFRQVGPGLSADAARRTLGEPLRASQGPRGVEWDYAFKFRMPDSSNYLICQYKLVLDDSGQQLRETAWRRRQCLDLVERAS